jgi:hypothetical protein
MKKHSTRSGVTTVGDLVADLFSKYQNDFHNDAIAASVTRDVVHELRRLGPRHKATDAVPPSSAGVRRVYVTA